MLPKMEMEKQLKTKFEYISNLKNNYRLTFSDPNCVKGNMLYFVKTLKNYFELQMKFVMVYQQLYILNLIHVISSYY
jgi:hypothetical protein